MKHFKNILAFAFMVTLQSCNSAGFGGGLWFIPVITLGIGSYCWYLFLSNLKKTGISLVIPLVFAILFSIATIVALIVMAAEK